MTERQGTPIWFELNTADVDAAERFYASLAGWSVATSPMPEHGGYRVASAPDGGGVAGIMTPPPGMGAPGWSIYFAVDDVDAAVKKIAELGGTVQFGPMDIPHVGRFAAAADPQGVGFTLMRASSEEPGTAFATPDGTTLGHGVWVELATPDPDAALGFYGDLFGWSKQGAMPMGPMGDYTFIGSEDFRPGAVMSSATTGAPARWNWYVDVADIDAAIATATAAGATLVQGPDEIPGGAFSANLTDPEGLPIGIVGPRKAQ